MSKFLKKAYPLLEGTVDLLGIDKNQLRKKMIDMSNKKTRSKQFHLKPNEILVLLPHCLQLQSCDIRITTNIYNCKRCKKCDIAEIVAVCEKYGVNVVVATGGTLARRAIVDIRPKGIIAVACERDLTSGIVDVGEMDVIGILNDRPNGPCIDTKVDIKKLEEAILFYLGGA